MRLTHRAPNLGEGIQFAALINPLKLFCDYVKLLSDNPIFYSRKRDIPPVKPSSEEQASIGLQMRALLESLKGRRLTA
jgi:hypothetical protein